MKILSSFLSSLPIWRICCLRTLQNLKARVGRDRPSLASRYCSPGDYEKPIPNLNREFVIWSLEVGSQELFGGIYHWVKSSNLTNGLKSIHQSFKAPFLIYGFQNTFTIFHVYVVFGCIWRFGDIFIIIFVELLKAGLLDLLNVKCMQEINNPPFSPFSGAPVRIPVGLRSVQSPVIGNIFSQLFLAGKKRGIYGSLVVKENPALWC